MKVIRVLGATVGATLSAMVLYVGTSREAWAERLVQQTVGAILICMMAAGVGFVLFIAGWMGWELSGEAVRVLTDWRKGRSR
jgi:hypothetical protein